MHIFDFVGFWPVKNGLDLLLVHAKTFSGEDVAEVFNFIFVPFTFWWTSIKAVLPESPKYFLDMSFVLRHIIRVDEDIIEVNDNTDIEHICEDFVHVMLESSRHIEKSEGIQMSCSKCGMSFSIHHHL